MNPLPTMQGLTFGVEIETIHLNREQLARAVARITGGTARYSGGFYDRWVVRLPDGREWYCVTDNSLTGGRGGRNGEVVTPICTYADIEMIQKVARELHKDGARVDASCGIHVHIGAAPLCENQFAPLLRLAKLVYQQEPLIFRALGVQGFRERRFARPVDERTIRTLATQRPQSREALAAAWYGNQYEARAAQRDHYHDSRYHGLNLHSVFFRGTVEFRYFEATLHAGKIKTYIQFCLALAAKALTAKSSVARKRTFNPDTAKYDFRVFLIRLGLNGAEFKTARLHLLSMMAGCASYKHGVPDRATERESIQAGTTVVSALADALHTYDPNSVEITVGGVTLQAEGTAGLTIVHEPNPNGEN